MAAGEMYHVGASRGFSLGLIRKEETPIRPRTHGAEIGPKGEYITLHVKYSGRTFPLP